MRQFWLSLFLVCSSWRASVGHRLGDSHTNEQGTLDSRSEKLRRYYGQYLLKEDRAPFVRPDWGEARRKAQEFLSDWSIEGLVNLTAGVGWEVGEMPSRTCCLEYIHRLTGSNFESQSGNCVGNIAAMPDKGFPGLCLEDSPLGVRFADRVSVFPAGINTAAT